jgi:hypothetical protein
MDKKIVFDEKVSDIKCDSPQEEGKDMPALAKEQSYEGLSLSSKKLKEITVKPKVKNGKILFDKKDKDHRYIVEEGY